MANGRLYLEHVDTGERVMLAWESLLTATSCYECGCIGCSTGCKAGGRE